MRDLDAELRAVPLPEGLLGRLRAVALADVVDDELDAALREVPVPEGLLTRLRLAPVVDDEGLDATLRDVHVPSRLMASWRRRARHQDRLLRISRLAVAVSLLVAVALSYFGAKIISLLPGDAGGTKIARPTASPVKPEELQDSWAAGTESQTPTAAIAQARPPKVELAIDQHRPASPRTDLPPGSDPLREVMPSVSTSPIDNLADLPTRVVGLVPRGIDWPRVPAAHWEILLRYGVHPFVSPAADSKLQTSIVPLGIGTASYDLARRWIASGFLPPPDKVRTEEFLAAMDYDFPRPEKQALRICAAAGPSPIRGEGFCLVQVGVQARQIADQTHPPVHLVLVVDTSGSMRWGGRVDMIRRALKSWASRLGPADRLSLISFDRGAHLLVQNVAPGEIGQFMAAVDSLSADGATSVGSGLNEAYTLAQQETGGTRPPVRIVLLTDGLLELDDSQAEHIKQRASEAAGNGIPLFAVDLGQSTERDPQLVAIAEAGHGAVQRATSVDQVRWALQEIVTGKPQLVARNAQLKVTFNPKTVLEYRLLGHESSAFAGLMPQRPQADFREDQSATALYEVRLATKGPQEVATVELTWRDPSGERPRGRKDQQKATRRVDRKQFAAGFAQSAPWLQEAALAAAAAEALRQSPFAPPRPSITLYRIWELASQVDSQVKQKPSFNEFLTMVDQATRAKPPRNAGKRP